MRDVDTAADAFEPLWERGISRAVAAARGYVPYFGRHHPRHDAGLVRAAYESFSLTPGQRATISRFTNQARSKDGDAGYGDGLIMPKHPFPGERPILPQLRPRHELPTGASIRHRHDSAFSSASDLARHLEREHPGEDVADDLLHEHENLAKYLLPPKARQSVAHDHATDPWFEGLSGRSRLIAHLGGKDHGLDRSRLRRMSKGRLLAQVEGPHTHRRPVAGQSVANRVEIHPWALALLPHADTVYFVLEGTPKADSILTRIIETGRRASVCDVPSVTLWRDPGLRRVARGFLQGFGSEPPLVVVVADADWHANPRVERQALLLRECLRREGVNACVAAPPDHKGANGELLYKGVDDYLVGGGELDSLVVLDREAPIRLALFAAEDGTIRNSPTSLAPLLGCRRDATRVKGLLERHIENGEATVDRQLVLRREGQDRVVGWRGSRDDWPTITIAPDFRYTQRFVPLSKYDRVSAREKVASEVFAEEVVRVIREAAEARLWANGGRGELWRRVYDDALDATAERLGQKPETIRRDEVLAQMYAMARQTRDFVIVMSSGNFSERKIARMVGVSPATVKTALKK